MTAVVGTAEEELSLQRRRYEKAGQDHVFVHIATLSDERRAGFLRQLAGLPVEALAALLAAARSGDGVSAVAADGRGGIQPFAGAVSRSSGAFFQTGIEAISQGRVAALVLAGGQGTRLGFAGPKGMYDIGLPSGKTLFALVAERIVKLSSLAGNGAARPPFYIMTSPLNHDETVAYFEGNDYFGLPASDVYFFRQGMLPCLTNDGKIILEAADQVAMAPDGNGGIYPSLQSSGALDDMQKRGVQYLHVFSIDNALVKPADPGFIGYCIHQGADCGNKVVWKAHAHEKVGVVASRNGQPCIVEYSEITAAMAELTVGDGTLVYGAGNICNHFYTLDFIRDSVLPNMGKLYHVAHKKIAYYDAASAATIAPDTNNGIKLESFIFDVFPFSKRMAVLDVERSDEFAPVKNEPGAPSDSPDTARALISALAKKWVSAAGATLTGDVSSLCEISPLTSYAGEGLDGIARGKVIACPFVL